MRRISLELALVEAKRRWLAEILARFPNLGRDHFSTLAEESVHMLRDIQHRRRRPPDTSDDRLLGSVLVTVQTLEVRRVDGTDSIRRQMPPGVAADRHDGVGSVRHDSSRQSPSLEPV